MSITYSGDNIQDTDGGVLRPISSVMRNRIINGAMVIDQRNAGASVSLTSTQTYIVDRWSAAEDTDGTMTAQQSTVAPVGFTNSFLFTTGTADASLSASQFASTRQIIEGFNIADLGWGTASAKTVTLSFWVRSSLTGTFGGSLRNSANNRSYPFSYIISSANTWEQKSVTIAGDTSGTWLTNNGSGIGLTFSLGAGSNFEGTAGAWNSNNNITVAGAVSVIGTAGATFYITGVQLEVGSSATGFEYRQYGQELALCQRYFEKSYSQATVPGTATEVNAVFGSGQVSTGTTGEIGNGFQFKVIKRAAPTITFYDSTGASGKGNRILLGVGNTAGQTFNANYVGDGATFVNSSGANANIQEFHYTASAEL